jgi:hypothetical protein
MKTHSMKPQPMLGDGRATSIFVCASGKPQRPRSNGAETGGRSFPRFRICVFPILVPDTGLSPLAAVSAARTVNIVRSRFATASVARMRAAVSVSGDDCRGIVDSALSRVGDQVSEEPRKVDSGS